MTQQESKHIAPSKRIASNTIVLFVRMFILTVINLYAVRLILKGLGESGYGLFTTIAGVVAIAGLLNVVLALSIQRFYSFYLGKHDEKQLKEIFSTSVNIVAILSLVAFILLETFGLWFVNTQLVIPIEQKTTSFWVYQFAIFIFIASMWQIPYIAAIFSHEDMGTYTWISTVECLLKLAVAWGVGYAFFDSLTFYSAGLFVTAVIVFVSYVVMGRRYAECHYRKPENKKLYKELLSFSGWTFLGSASNAGMIQGNIILLNIFFGPVINAAFGIALQINNAFGTLCNTMVLAFRPPMIKAYAEQRFDYLNKLFSVSNKFVFYLLLMVGVPIIVEMNTILDFWLDDMSSNIVLFARLIIVYVICLALNSPITIIMQASGRIKEYHLYVEGIILMCIPLSWLLFKMQMPSYAVFFSMIGVVVAAHLVRLVCLWYFYRKFSIREYLFSFLVPALLITIVCVMTAYYVHQNIQHLWCRLIAVFLLSPVVTFCLVYVGGINRTEKQLLKDFIQKHILKKDVANSMG